jgi:iron complex outermembrane receptor protein
MQRSRLIDGPLLWPRGRGLREHGYVAGRVRSLQARVGTESSAGCELGGRDERPLRLQKPTGDFDMEFSIATSRHAKQRAFVSPLASLALSATALFFSQMSIASSSALDRQVEFAIPAQSLQSALLEFSRQSGVPIFVAASSLKQLDAPAISGKLPARAALSQLLGGTGLTYSSVGEAVTVQASSEDTNFRNVALRALRVAQDDSNAAEGSEGRSPSSDGLLEEVVVTAQKREERLRDVPISISVLSGDDLDKSTAQGVTESLNRVPGVAASPASQTGGTVVSMRGASPSSPIGSGSSPVAYYLDSVPFGLMQTPIAPDASGYDLERVEVLRGPQGTLYGANAQAGVVRILTKDADLNNFDVKFRGSGSGTENGGNSYRGDLAVNAPLIAGKLAARAVVGYEDSAGWIDGTAGEDINDALLRNWRLKLNAQPTEQLSIGLSAWISRRDYGAPSASDDNQRTSTTLDLPYSIDYDVFGLKIGYDFSAVSVTSTTSYLEYSTAGSSDLQTLFGLPTSLALFTDLDSRVFAQELYFNSSQQGAWRWTAGAMYRDATDINVQAVPDFFLGPLLFDWTNISRSYAVFGEISRRFLDGKLEWTLGGRYFHDDVLSREDRLLPPLIPPSYYRAEDSFDSTTPRVVLNWRPNTELSVYGSYSQGFRSGTPQSYITAGGDSTFPRARPDKLRNYEIGAKGGSGRFAFDAAVYYMDWKDVQQTLTVLVGGTTPVTAIANGESVSGLGVDLGLTTRPIEGLELGVDFSWNDLTLDADLLSGPNNAVLFAAGDRPNYSPEYTAGVSGDYAFPLGGGGYRGRLTASANYVSKQGFRAIVNGAQALAFGDSMLITRAAFAVRAPENWEISLFGDNLNNERDAVVGNPFDGPDASVRVRPRTIGVQVEYTF